MQTCREIAEAQPDPVASSSRFPSPSGEPAIAYPRGNRELPFPPVARGEILRARALLPRSVLNQWWKSAEIARDLKLTDAQVAQLDQMSTEQRLRLIDLRAGVEKQETLLLPLVDVDRPDDAMVAAQLDQVLSARGRLEKTQALMLLVVRRVLSVEQWRRLRVLHEGAMSPPGRPLPRRPPPFLPRVEG